MLEFIVLGQVPGTHIQLSFGNVIVLWLTVLCAYVVITGGRKYKPTIKTEINILLIYLSLRLHR